MDCVKNYGYNNLSLSRVVARVFSLKSTPQHMWVIWVYIVWVETWCIRYKKFAKQNVSRVSHEKALPARHSWKPVVIICHDSSHSSHVLSTYFTSQGKLLASYPQKLLWSSIYLESSHSLSHTTLTIKSHIKYRVQKIEQNYNQIWHEIKANTN